MTGVKNRTALAGSLEWPSATPEVYPGKLLSDITLSQTYTLTRIQTYVIIVNNNATKRCVTF